MAQQSAIVHLAHHAIDTQQWDACVHASPHGLLYSLSGYLHCICPGWHGLVDGAYEAVMPVPVKTKWGWPYVYQPWGLAQGGVCATNGRVMTADFLAALQASQLRYGTLDLNEADAFLPSNKQLQIRQRTNLVLPLSRPYSSIIQGYTDDAQKNLRRASRHGLQLLTSGVPVEAVADLYRAQYGQQNPAAQGPQLQAMVRAGRWLLQQGWGFTVGVQSAQGGGLLAAALFGYYKRRLYYLMGAPTKQGRQRQAVYFLLDSVIQQYAETASLLDFEGSDIESVAAFYKRFGASNRPYPSLHLNRLPWPLKLLKK